MEKCSGVSEMRNAIAIVAGPKDWGDTRESWLARVPRKVKTVSFRTVKALWYGEILDVDHWAARDIRAAATLIEARKESNSLATQYESIAGGLTATDPDFHSADVAALLHAARILRGLDRAGN